MIKKKHEQFNFFFSNVYSWLQASLIKLLKKIRQFDHSILMDLLFVSDMKDR